MFCLILKKCVFHQLLFIYFLKRTLNSNFSGVFRGVYTIFSEKINYAKKFVSTRDSNQPLSGQMSRPLTIRPPWPFLTIKITEIYLFSTQDIIDESCYSQNFTFKEVLPEEILDFRQPCAVIKSKSHQTKPKKIKLNKNHKSYMLSLMVGWKV